MPGSTIRCRTVSWTIPGYLVWAAFIYAAIATLITHLIGRPLVNLNFNRQRFEAYFRFNLVRVRENAEQIALLARRDREARAPARPVWRDRRQLA
jgi:putative ATP-binding cassette transporter